MFVKPNELLALYFPAYEGIIVFRVRRHLNPEAYAFLYGPLPISFTGYEEGVIPANQVTEWITFPYRLLPEEYRSDMFYFVEENKLIHAYITVEPSAILRGYLMIPAGQQQYTFRGIIAANPGTSEIESTDFGFFRGTKEMIFIPRVRIQWAFANRSNLDVRTNVKIKYAEYDVEIINDPNIILDVMWGKISSYQYTWGGITRSGDVERVFRDVWNTWPARFVPRYIERSEALRMIEESITRGV